MGLYAAVALRHCSVAGESILLRMCLSLRLRPVPRRQFPCWHACLTRPPRAEEIIRDPRQAMVGKAAPLLKSFQDMGGERATLSTSSYDRRQSYEREKIFVIVE